MISTYIKELLQKHNRVIVPDLGAFLRKNDNPDSVYFNEFLRFNDGLLVDYFSQKENVDKFDSIKKIKEYVTEVNQKLLDKQSVELKGIGSLYVDANDKIQLKVELLKVFSPEEAKQPEEPIQAEEPVKKPKKSSESKKNAVSNGKEEIVPPIAKPIEEIKKEPVIQSIKENPVVVEQKEEIKRVIEEPKPEKTIFAEDTFQSGKTLTQESARPVFEPDYKKSSSNKGWIWIIILIVLVLLVLSWFFIIKPRIYKATDQNNTLRQDSVVVTPVPKTEISEPVSDITDQGQKYYIVAGCFAMESNADKFVQSLLAKGYSPKKFAKIEELYFVSIASFNDKKEAFKELNKLAQQGYSGCWVKFY
jgi:nucleoid DNA-binding protein